MSIRVNDMDKVEAWTGGGGRFAPGKHDVQISDAEERISKAGNPMAVLTYDALDGSASITDFVTFTEKTLGRPRRLLDVLGIVPDSGEWEFPTAELKGKQLTIQVGLEPDRDDPLKMWPRVQGYHEPGSAPPEPTGNGSADSDDDLPF